MRLGQDLKRDSMVVQSNGVSGGLKILPIKKHAEPAEPVALMNSIGRQIAGRRYAGRE